MLAFDSAVWGQLAEGLRHESFDIGGWNAQDRTLAELKAAPDFQYVPNPAEAERQPTGGGDQTKKTTP